MQVTVTQKWVIYLRLSAFWNYCASLTAETVSFYFSQKWKIWHTQQNVFVFELFCCWSLTQATEQKTSYYHYYLLQDECINNDARCRKEGSTRQTQVKMANKTACINTAHIYVFIMDNTDFQIKPKIYSSKQQCHCIKMATAFSWNFYKRIYGTVFTGSAVFQWLV